MTASGQHASLGEILDAVERDESLGGTPGGPGVSQERENPERTSVNIIRKTEVLT